MSDSQPVTLVAPAAPEEELITLLEAVDRPGTDAAVDFLVEAYQEFNAARVPGNNRWTGSDGNPARMMRVSWINGAFFPLAMRPHVMKTVGSQILILVVRVGHEAEDTAALVALLEAQEQRTIVRSPNPHNVYWLFEGDDDAVPIHVVAIVPRQTKPSDTGEAEGKEG